MSIGRFQIIFYSVFVPCILIIIISFNSFEFVELDIATDWAMKYFALPILIFTTPLFYLIYTKLLIQHETKYYKSDIKTKLRTIFRVLVFTFAMTMIFVGTALSMILLTNANIGNEKTLNINAKIIDYYSRASKGRTRHYIKIKDKQLDRIVELKVNHPYKIGEDFTKSINIGYWGLLYSK